MRSTAHRIPVSARRNAIDADRLSQARRDLGGPEATRTHLAYGPRTRREFLRLRAWAGTAKSTDPPPV